MIGEFSPDPDWSALHAYEGLTLLRDFDVVDLAARFRARLIYLATPYSRRAVDENGAWCLHRSMSAATEASAWAWRLARAGLTAVSPVMLSAQMVQDEYTAEHPHEDAIGPLDHAAWEAWCRPLLAASELVAIPPIDGWEVSRGIWREAVAALAVNKPVIVMEEG